MSKTMALKPRVSEKAYGMSESQNTYVFAVPITANKVTIAAAVTEQFAVTVENVHVIIAKGKTKRSYRKGSRPAIGRRADVKKAYVRLKTGDVINVFGKPEEEKADKKAAKKVLRQAQDKKETK